ncbi:MAG: hypothetical protein MUF66_06325, partial [Gammaproteobacteria bacterium]|nr:hypothetical protein [Gammaproteobacteria bacterium]
KEAVRLPPGEDVQQAINRVLTAEQDARGAVDECRRQAQGMLEAARARSRQILERSDDYISRARALADATVERRLAELKAESASFSDASLVDEDRIARVRQLVPLLALELLGSRE